MLRTIMDSPLQIIDTNIEKVKTTHMEKEGAVVLNDKALFREGKKYHEYVCTFMCIYIITQKENTLHYVKHIIRT